ncbi:MAG: hypothetical protein AAFU77_02265 [Myxococcota bacterium]
MDLLESPFATLHVDPSRCLARLTRSSVNFTSPEDARGFVEDVARAIKPMTSAGYVVLSDVRSATGATNKETEEVLKELRTHLLETFSRVALLVRTEAGRLQSERFGREQENSVAVFRDEESALAYLFGGGQ